MCLHNYSLVVKSMSSYTVNKLGYEEVPHYKTRGRDNVGVLCACRYEVPEICDDDIFYETLVTTRYPSYAYKPNDMSWEDWYSYLTLGDKVLIGFSREHHNPIIGIFSPSTTLGEVINWFQDRADIYKIPPLVLLVEDDTYIVGGSSKELNHTVLDLIKNQAAPYSAKVMLHMNPSGVYYA